MGDLVHQYGGHTQEVTSVAMWGENLFAGSDSGACTMYWTDGADRARVCGQSAQQDDEVLAMTRDALDTADAQRVTALGELRLIRQRVEMLEETIYKGSHRRRVLQRRKLEMVMERMLRKPA